MSQSTRRELLKKLRWRYQNAGPQYKRKLLDQGRALTRPGTLLRQQIPIRGSVWEEGQVGWLEVDTVALCGGSIAGEFAWVVDGVEYVTTWVKLRAIWGRGQANTLGALQDIEESLPFALLGLDSDNSGWADFVQLRVNDQLGNQAYETPAMGKAGALTGTCSNAVIKARTLTPGQTVLPPGGLALTVSRGG